MGIRPFDSLTGDIGAHRRTVHRKVSALGMTSAQKRPVNRIRRLVHITRRGFLGRHRTPERHVKVLFPAHNRAVGPPEGKIAKPRRKPERHGCKLLRRHHIAHGTIAANVHATVAEDLLPRPPTRPCFPLGPTSRQSCPGSTRHAAARVRLGPASSSAPPYHPASANRTTTQRPGYPPRRTAAPQTDQTPSGHRSKN